MGGRSGAGGVAIPGVRAAAPSRGPGAAGRLGWLARARVVASFPMRPAAVGRHHDPHAHPRRPGCTGPAGPRRRSADAKQGNPRHGLRDSALAPDEAFRAVAAVTVGRTCAGRACALKAPRAAPNPTGLILDPALDDLVSGRKAPGWGAMAPTKTTGGIHPLGEADFRFATPGGRVRDR